MARRGCHTVLSAAMVAQSALLLAVLAATCAGQAPPTPQEVTDNSTLNTYGACVTALLKRTPPSLVHGRSYHCVARHGTCPAAWPRCQAGAPAYVHVHPSGQLVSIALQLVVFADAAAKAQLSGAITQPLGGAGNRAPIVQFLRVRCIIIAS